jgi:unsaturated pyranuronate lyase
METQNKTYPDLVVIRSDQAKESHPELGLARRVLAYNDKLFLAEHQMVKAWAGAMHSHPHDQVVYTVRGHLKVNCLGKTFELRAGDSFVVRGGVQHGASAIEEWLVIDAFTAGREDYISWAELLFVRFYC